MTFDDRYASAVRSSNLKSKPDTLSSDSDVLGAAGLAGKKAPLALALARLFSGDNHAVREIVELLEEKVVGKAFRVGVEITRLQAADMGRSVLAWHRDGTCKACGGHGFRLVGDARIGQGRASLSEHHCQACKGSRKVLFDRQFALERLDLARWLLAEVEREMAIAGPLAMAKLAPRLDP
jgi:hypothetical protein